LSEQTREGHLHGERRTQRCGHSRNHAGDPAARDGAAADYVAVPAVVLAPKPRSLGHVEAAAVPLAALSAWQGLFVHGLLEEGQRVLITGASGGVGHFATQLARWRGARVIASVSAGDAESVRGLGAHEVVDQAVAGFEGAIDPVDLVFDTVGGSLLEHSPAVVRPGGRVVSVAEEPPKLPPEAKVAGVYFVVEPDRGQLVELARLVDEGVVRPAIDSVFPLAEARAAFARTMARGKRGKVVIRIADA
jgi:NADPH:quinone reductase-like Zn-dependent oxidoreductase